MGFRVVRIGKTVWNPRIIKRYPLVSFLVVMAVYILIAKLFIKDDPMWYKVIFFIISGWTYSAIDNQLPRKRYRDLAIILGGFTLLFSSIVFKELVINKNRPNLDTADFAIMAALTILPLIYCIYSVWRLRREIMMYKEIKLQRELRAKRKRSLGY
ncbi:MAG: hypothetical protein IKY82_07950 [Alistipes sp.]|nr:hypothetical protein [Alistipes sp.]